MRLSTTFSCLLPRRQGHRLDYDQHITQLLPCLTISTSGTPFRRKYALYKNESYIPPTPDMNVHTLHTPSPKAQEIHQLLANSNQDLDAVLDQKKAARKEISSVPKISPDDIFINSEVRMSEIEAYGFDYDYTLAQYSVDVQHEIYESALHHLIYEFKYPPHMSNSLKYDPGFPIRGLHYDMRKGYLMKLDYLLNIQLGAVYFGRRLVSKEECIDAYGSLQLRNSDAETYLRSMSDIFCLPEACLISDVIEFLTLHNYSFEPHIIYEDITRAVNTVHHSGKLHQTIMRDLPRYLDKHPALGSFLFKLKNAGKKLFLMTNSPYAFADAGMKFLLHDQLSKTMKHWTDLFDVVITQCEKPNFFGRGRPFRIQDTTTGRLYWNKIDHFESGQVYVGGSLNEFMRISGWKGNKVMYFGDHLFSDLMEPSIREGWRTGVIIKELEMEVAIQNSPQYRLNLADLLATEELIHQCQFYQGEEKESILKKLKGVSRFIVHDQVKNGILIQFSRSLSTRILVAFSVHTPMPQCLRILFSGITPAHNIKPFDLPRYADLYTSKIENFANCPLDFSFYPARNYLPHEFKLN